MLEGSPPAAGGRVADHLGELDDGGRLLRQGGEEEQDGDLEQHPPGHKRELERLGQVVEDRDPEPRNDRDHQRQDRKRWELSRE